MISKPWYCPTNCNSLFPLLSLFLSDTHTPVPTLTEKLIEFPDELQGKGTQLYLCFFPRMPEAHGKARLENQVKMLIMGKKMLRRQARREEKVLGKQKEVSERRGGWGMGEAVFTAR